MGAALMPSITILRNDMRTDGLRYRAQFAIGRQRFGFPCQRFAAPVMGIEPFGCSRSIRYGGENIVKNIAKAGCAMQQAHPRSGGGVNAGGCASFAADRVRLRHHAFWQDARDVQLRNDRSRARGM
jgi:hypothetical protein